jgi:hypothetical protein
MSDKNFLLNFYKKYIQNYLQLHNAISCCQMDQNYILMIKFIQDSQQTIILIQNAFI